MLLTPSFANVRRAVGMMTSRDRPMIVQLVVTRRCNLSCGYCYEYDDHSAPVPTDTLLAYIDHIADLGTLVLTLTGGEPLLHPDLDRLVDRVRRAGMVPTSITNGYALTESWIHRLNDAGLALLQVSVDNIEPNDWSSKSWVNVRKRLEQLRDHARFTVNVNAVLGSCTPAETRRVVDDVRAMGFFMTVGLMHDVDGQIERGLLDHELVPLYEEIHRERPKSLLHRVGEGWEHQLLLKGSAPWKCRAGARYLYIDEFGVVSYCSQRRGTPGVPILSYTHEHLRREFETPKGCESRCTIGCARRASALDEWRSQRGG